MEEGGNASGVVQADGRCMGGVESGWCDVDEGRQVQGVKETVRAKLRGRKSVC